VHLQPGEEGDAGALVVATARFQNWLAPRWAVGFRGESQQERRRIDRIRLFPMVQGADITRRRWLRSMAQRAAWQPRGQKASPSQASGTTPFKVLTSIRFRNPLPVGRRRGEGWERGLAGQKGARCWTLPDPHPPTRTSAAPAGAQVSHQLLRAAVGGSRVARA
jgi:hypothetical protein